MNTRRDSADPRPRYRQIADELLEQIRSGRHPIGAMLPTETELCALHGASRHTIREALRLVEEAGLVSRRQGSGTSVIAHEPPERFVQDITSMGGLLQYPPETWLTLLSAREVKLDAERAALLGVAEGETWLRVETLRRARITTAPICCTSVFIPLDYAAAVDGLGTERGPVYAEVERRFGVRISTVEVELTACGVPESQAMLLDAEAGSPALMIRRRYMDQNGRFFEISESCHPAARFTYRAVVKRE
ncbi:GntR family transcriptional regulator [Roseococcus sp. YIM B11640]|uniref:GntR family transcriptional regulator n=1 Tax=Roseococcus sp. YIM B11640 TaxID=3133973 RepID=UPI003C7BEB55